MELGARLVSEKKEKVEVVAANIPFRIQTTNYFHLKAKKLSHITEHKIRAAISTCGS